MYAGPTQGYPNPNMYASPTPVYAMPHIPHQPVFTRPDPYIGQFTGNPYHPVMYANGHQVETYRKGRGKRNRNFHPYQGPAVMPGPNHFQSITATIPTRKHANGNGQPKVSTRNLSSSMHAPSMTYEAKLQALAWSIWGPLLAISRPNDFKPEAISGPRDAEHLFYATNEQLNYAAALIEFRPDEGLPDEVGWGTEDGSLVPTGSVLEAIQQGRVPIEAEPPTKEEQEKLNHEVRSAIERCQKPGDFNAAYTVFQNEVLFTLWNLLAKTIPSHSASRLVIPPHLALHGQLFRPEMVFWLGRFMPDRRDHEESIREGRKRLQTVSAPGVNDDDLDWHCLWLAVHGDASNAPGVMITHTGQVDKYGVLGWLTIRRLWDSIYKGTLVDTSKRAAQKTNLTRHFLELTCTPDLYEQELKGEGLTIGPQRLYYPPDSTFENRTEVAAHLAKCGISLTDMARYMSWGLQYVCDTLNHPGTDSETRKLYVEFYRKGLARLQFIRINEGGRDRTYNLPSSFPLDAVHEQRRQRCEKREIRHYQPGKSSNIVTGDHDTEMVNVTNSVQGMSMIDAPPF